MIKHDWEEYTKEPSIISLLRNIHMERRIEMNINVILHIQHNIQNC